jgi:hypothetical protein
MTDTCPRCKLPKRLNRHGLCASCTLAQANAGVLDAETEVRLQRVADEAQGRPPPERVRKRRKIGGRREG